MKSSTNQIHSPTAAQKYFEDKLAFTTGPVELERWIKAGEDNLVVVDVRAEEDYAKGHIPGAINVPKEQWQAPQGLARDKTNVVYCYTQQCHLAANACCKFASLGYPVMELEGGFGAWKDNELDVEERPEPRFKSSPQRMAGR
jgi:rhodanese-related sulfurtransferase